MRGSVHSHDLRLYEITEKEWLGALSGTIMVSGGPAASELLVSRLGLPLAELSQALERLQALGYAAASDEGVGYRAQMG